MNEVWTKYGDSLVESVKYIEDRASGKVKSLKTGWKQFDNIGYGGLEWGSFYLIASRPGVGKTLIINQLTRNVQKLNKDENPYILHFQFEMDKKNLAARELSSATGLRLRYLLSSKEQDVDKLSQEHLKQLKTYVNSQYYNRNEYVIDKQMSVDEIKYYVYEFYKKFKKPFIATLDHTMLIKKTAGEPKKQITIENFSNMAIESKKELPMIWIVGSQLNRTLESAERQNPGKLTNFPTSDDIYMSDALMQGCDVVLAYNRPAKYNLKFYGPTSYVLSLDDKNLLACHILKNRFGNDGIHWYRALYDKMSVIETEAPKKRGEL